MPAFLSISFLFEKPVSTTLVRHFYELFLDDRISFAGVFAWGCSSEMSLEDVITWNQDQIERDFIPKGNTNISHYPRQILLSIDGSSSARLIMSNSDKHVHFTCIVAESEVGRVNMRDIEKASLRAWRQLPVKLVETYGEMDDPVGLSRTQKGEMPSCRVFALTDVDLTRQSIETTFSITELGRGVLLKLKSISGQW